MSKLQTDLPLKPPRTCVECGAPAGWLFADLEPPKLVIHWFCERHARDYAESRRQRGRVKF